MSDKETRTSPSRTTVVTEGRAAADAQAQADLARQKQEAEIAGEQERLAELRAANADAAENIRQEIARKTPAEERADAMAKAPGHALLLMLFFLICYLIAAATGRADIISFPRSRDVVQPTGLDTQLNTGSTARGATGSGSAQAFEVGTAFSSYYAEHNGARLFGRPISGVMQVNGREAQWFERARLERWPENAGTAYEVQPGLVGVEYTQNIPFPNQQFFVSSTDQVYSRITEHAVSDVFFQFYAANGGLDMFGYPISDELQELLPTTGQQHTVQYFERARLEYHPEYAGTESEIQIGLLGRELYLNDSAPNIVSAAKPTPVPVP